MLETTDFWNEILFSGRKRQRLTLSKTLKASLISSSLSVSFIFLAIIVKNSGKSMVPFPRGQKSKGCRVYWTVSLDKKLDKRRLHDEIFSTMINTNKNESLKMFMT